MELTEDEIRQAINYYLVGCKEVNANSIKFKTVFGEVRAEVKRVE